MENTGYRQKTDAKNRRVLCYKPSEESASLIPEMAARGWEVHVARDSREAQHLLQDRKIFVGMAPVDLPSLQPEELVEITPPSSRMEWLALLHQQESLESADLTRFIADQCYDYLTMPVDPTRLMYSLGHAWGMAHMQARSQIELPTPEKEKYMVGSSAVMLNLFRAIRKVASVDAPVLIGGESGTGKELTARAIHERSGRAEGPFVAVNCGALPANLIQSELFGHEKGAFTGASARKIGLIEAAQGGTIFLDEIGDLPLDLQVNLLRFLQESSIERVGGRESIKVNARVIAATHVNLEQAVADGRFREDLYYRLQVLNIHVPPLRERGEDVVLMARYFFEKFGADKSRQLKGFSQKALLAMKQYDWPGNVRELINRVRRAMVMAEGRLITPQDLGLAGRQVGMGHEILTLAEARTRAERDAILHALACSNKNVSAAARSLGVSRVTLYRLLEKYRIHL